jgi:hypothetical protein
MRSGRPAAAEALLSRLLQPVLRSKPGFGSIKKHTRDAMAFHE